MLIIISMQLLDLSQSFCTLHLTGNLQCDISISDVRRLRKGHMKLRKYYLASLISVES